MSLGNPRVAGRRRFLGRVVTGTLGIVAAPCVIPSSALGAGDRPSPSNRIAIGFVGVGGHGIAQNLNGFLHQADAEPVVLCDVDGRQIAEAAKMVRQRRGEHVHLPSTKDWRDVIARRDVDAVMISTPDHWHVPIALAALRAGKDVICEKPTLTLHDGRVLADTVARFGAVFQLSTEDRSLAVYHRMAELVRNQRIGKLKHIYVKLPPGPGSPADATPKPVPPKLDWEMWLGPAPWSPYRDGLHQFMWRCKSDYSGGLLTDWGAHLLDTAQWANDTERTGPVEISGVGHRHPTGLYDIFYEYKIDYRYANGVTMRVQSGGVALRFEGTEGWIGNNGWIGALEASRPELLRTTIGPEEIHLFTCPAGEHRNFLDCVKSRRDPYFPAEIGHRCCSVAHLGNIAMELGRPLRWDPVQEVFPGDVQANRMRSRAMREPWTL